jgi:hypothetical protein
MKRIIVKYSCGFGRHVTDIEIEDDTPPEDIEKIVADFAMEHFDWSYEIEGEDQ